MGYAPRGYVARMDSYYVLIRVADADPTLASPGLQARRVTTPCRTCQEPCWLDPLSAAHIDPRMPRVCMQCADDLIGAQAAQVPQ